MVEKGQARAGGRATLRDVADRAGVSTSTASLVFSGRGPVAGATADRVRAAARELEYSGPDPLASSLRRGRVGTVAVVVEGPLGMAFRDPFALAVLDGLSAELDGLGRSMLLVAQSPTDPRRAVEQLARQPVEAVVFPLCGMSENPLVEHLAARGVAMVGSGAPQGPRVHHVRTDEVAAMALTARHVVDLGHTRVAHLTMHLAPGATLRRVGPKDVASAAYPDAAGRLRGFLDVAGPRAEAVQAPELSVGAGEQAARVLLDVPPARRPTAVVAQADLLAAGAVRAAESLGLRVPGDVSVTGFDGVDLPWLDHTLTTVLQPGVAKGHALGGLVRRALAGEAVEDEPFPVSLRIGTTTAAPRPG